MQAGRVAAQGSAEQVLACYRRSGEGEPTGLRWERPTGAGAPALAFRCIEVVVSGQQPRLALTCHITIEGSQQASDVLVAVDIKDCSGTVIMQAMPHGEAFISGSVGRQKIILEIELPPLVPGSYGMSFWIGPHYSCTMDSVQDGVTFVVDESPVEKRSFPHSRDHGFVVPFSTCKMLDG